MANTNQSVRTCILKVDIKCCTSCQNKASVKLKNISGVNEVEYNQEKGLMTVTGDVEPMALVRKLTKCGRKTELVSVKYQADDDDDDDSDEEYSSSSDTSSNPDPKTMERQIQQKMMMQTKKKKKTGIFGNPSSLLGCFSNKPKVVQPLPMRNRNWIPSKFENRPPGFGFPFANATTSQFRPPHQMMPHPSMMQQQPHPSMMQQPPHPPMMQQPQHPPMIQQPPHPSMMQQPPHPSMMQQSQHPPMIQQPPHPPMMQQLPQGPMTGAPHNVNTLWQALPPRQPYYRHPDQKVNPALHYQK